MVSGVPGVSGDCLCSAHLSLPWFLECFHPRKIFLGLRTELLRTCPRIGSSGTLSLSPHRLWVGLCPVLDSCRSESSEMWPRFFRGSGYSSQDQVRGWGLPGSGGWSLGLWQHWTNTGIRCEERRLHRQGPHRWVSWGWRCGGLSEVTVRRDAS